MNLQKTERLLVVDIFKNICALCIVTYHVWEAFLSDYNFDLSNTADFWLFKFFKQISSTGLYFSSLFIIAISFFLFGFKKSEIKFQKYLLFIPAHLLSLYNVNEAAHDNFIYWDLFAFIFLAYLLIHIFSKLKNAYLDAVLLFGVLIFIPEFSNTLKQIFTEYSSPQIINILWGNSYSSFTNGWFVLPWIFYPLFFFRIGIFFKNNLDKLKNVTFYDLLTLTLIGICIFNFLTMNTAYEYNLKYDQIVFDPNSRQVLSIFFIPLIIFRLSLLINFNTKTKILNNLWSTSFGVAYIFHFIIIITLSSLFSFKMNTINLLPLIIYIFVGYFPLFIFRLQSIFSKMEIFSSKK